MTYRQIAGRDVLGVGAATQQPLVDRARHRRRDPFDVSGDLRDERCVVAEIRWIGDPGERRNVVDAVVVPDRRTTALT